MNSVNIVGNLTRDPELRHTTAGKPVCDFGLAMAEYPGSESTVFLDVTVWGPPGESVAKFKKKGEQVAVTGRLRLDQWEKDGEKRQKLSVVAENVQFIGGKKED